MLMKKKLFAKALSLALAALMLFALCACGATVAFGAVIACLLAGMKLSKIAPLRWLFSAYIEVIRGTPMLLQLYFFYFACPLSFRRSTSRNFSASPLRLSATAPPMSPRSSVRVCSR